MKKIKQTLYSILFLKCPRCHEGPFLEANPYHISKMNKVKSHCPNCNLKYSIEPSFYTGAMYVSYAVGVAVAVAAYVLLLIFGIDFGPTGIFLTIIGALLILMPYIGAVSKAIWAHIFLK
ncbi:DUF983 domain-containing protein [Ulvibacter litoralis]|uniref:Uncharacterized conserved protein, DUF983 family n=1 Tax=Ulvibacter litoralis TaxID=227084 RepID=A0A1G7IBJ7_9FLAO|nr:DUF983 domain-containing protein [Ulvibacter litoralis]GHC61916.1 hypothetical protein GCM10008083_28720 [Ulvibacter litoralis]SDF09854.1 Uncharacterized conserved protein, DUF983 family [Ulvibacter litoralis]